MRSPFVKRLHRDLPLLATVADGSAASIANAAGHAGSTLFAADARTLFLAALRIGDVIVVCASALAAYWSYFGSYNPHRSELQQIVTGCLIAANLLHFANLYSIAGLRRRADHLRRLAGAWTLTVLALVATVYFTRSADEVSRGWVLSWALLGFAGLVAVRIVGWRWLRSWLRQERFMLKVAVIGEGAAAERLARRLEMDGNGDSRVVGVFRPAGPNGRPREDSAAAPDIDDLLRIVRRERVDEIAISLPCPHGDELSAALARLRAVPISVKLCADLSMAAGDEGVGRLLPSVAVFERPLAGWPILVKRCMDVGISGFLLLFLAPLMALVALLIKLDSPGPVLFRQQRFGFNQNPFFVYKFRTMYTAAAFELGVPQARRNDPRVTRIGRFLRRSSLDELPQLFNVLAGTMSLVGPRPHAIIHDEHYAKLIDGYLGRHRVRPGITGWAQVNGCRGETDTIEKMARRVEHDLFYIDHWSPFFDLCILARTALVGFCDDNAY